MLAIGRLVAVFLVMMAATYVAVVVALPKPAPAGWNAEDTDGGRLAAKRLVRQAQFLSGQRSTDALQ